MLTRDFQASFTEDIALARDYSLAFYQQHFDQFIDKFTETFNEQLTDICVAEIGAGCADIATRFAIQYPHSRVYAVEPEEALLFFAKPKVDAQRLHEQIRLFQQPLDNYKLPFAKFDVILSHWAIHRCDSPDSFWNSIKTLSTTGTRILICDYIRPSSKEHLKILAKQLNRNEPESLTGLTQRMLYSAYTVDEIKEQLCNCGLEFLKVDIFNTHQFIVHGLMT